MTNETPVIAILRLSSSHRSGLRRSGHKLAGPSPAPTVLGIVARNDMQAGVEKLPDREVIEILDGLQIEIMVSSEASNNACCVFDETTPPGAGPPPHKHLREEEIFTVLEGRHELLLGERWHPMEIGVSCLSPRDTFHAFRNVGDTPGRMMAMTTGGGIDDYFRAISRLKIPDDAAKFEEISWHYGYIYQTPS